MPQGRMSSSYHSPGTVGEDLEQVLPGTAAERCSAATLIPTLGCSHQGVTSFCDLHHHIVALCHSLDILALSPSGQVAGNFLTERNSSGNLRVRWMVLEEDAWRIACVKCGRSRCKMWQMRSWFAHLKDWFNINLEC